MLDHFEKRRRRQPPHLIAGTAIALALHAALIAALVLAARELGSPPRRVSTVSPVWEQGRPVELGIASGAAAGADPLLPSIHLPDTLQLGRTNRVRVILPPTRITPDSVLLLQLPGGRLQEVRIASPRLASLVAEHAIVVPRAPAMQLSLPGRSVEWSWNVRPTEPGPQNLLLRLDAVAHIEGRDSVLTLGSIRRQVFVRATMLQSVSRFFAYHWTWLSLLGVAAALAWLRERRRGRLASSPT